MKKLIGLLLTMLLLLMACGNAPAEAVPAETSATQAVETTTAAAEKEPGKAEFLSAAIEAEASAQSAPSVQSTASTEPAFVFLAEESLAANSKTMTYSTPKIYHNTLRNMGYGEYQGDMTRATDYSPVSCRPISLTYNQDVFRMEFDHLDVTLEMLEALAPGEIYLGELKEFKGWKLYGMKNATAPANISDFREEDFDCADIIKWDETLWEDSLIDSDFVQQVDYMFYNLENDLPTCLISVTAWYYPESGHLYNLVYEYEDPMGGSVTSPSLLYRNAEEMEINSGNNFAEKLDSNIDVTGVDRLFRLNITFGDNPSDGVYLYHPEGYIYTYYEPGMTFAQWRDSQYTHNHDWTVSMDGRFLVYNPVNWKMDEYGMYCLNNADKPIEDLVSIGPDGIPVIDMGPLDLSNYSMVEVKPGEQIPDKIEIQ